MDIKMLRYNALPCELETFEINGIHADTRDFGRSIDHREGVDLLKEDDEIVDYGCINSYFEIDDSNKSDICKKYNISEEEFEEICNLLSTYLRVGKCGWCV